MANVAGFLLRNPSFNSPLVPTASLDELLVQSSFIVSRTCLADGDQLLFDMGVYLLLASYAYNAWPLIGMRAAGQIAEESMLEQYVQRTVKYQKVDSRALSGFSGGKASNPFESQYLDLLAQECFCIGEIFSTPCCT